MLWLKDIITHKYPILERVICELESEAGEKRKGTTNTSPRETMAQTETPPAPQKNATGHYQCRAELGINLAKRHATSEEKNTPSERKKTSHKTGQDRRESGHHGKDKAQAAIA